MSVAALKPQTVQPPCHAQAHFHDRIQKQNDQEKFWMRRRDAISVESGGTALKEKKDMARLTEKTEKKVDLGGKRNQENGNLTVEKKDDSRLTEKKDHVDGNAIRRQKREKREANLAAYGRRKRKDPFLEVRLSLLGLETENADWSEVYLTGHESKGSTDKTKNISADFDRHEKVAESAAVTSPAFGLRMPYNTMSSILSDISFEEGSSISHSISFHSAQAVDETHRRGSESESAKGNQNVSEHMHSVKTEHDLSLNPPSTPKHQSRHPIKIDYSHPSPAITDESRASSGSTVNTSILFPNRESQRSSLGMLLISNDELFPKPPIRRGHDTFSEDGTVLARGALEMDEETPKAKPIEMDGKDYRDKPLPPIRHSSEDDRTIRQSISPLPSPIKYEPNILQAQNAIGLSLMPMSEEQAIPSKSPRRKQNTLSPPL